MAAAMVAGTVVALAVTPALVGSAGTAGALGPPGDWTVYHQNALGTGVDQSGASFANVGPAWTSPVLDGELYGEPLGYDGMVVAATENDTVYALDDSSGNIIWQTHIATPVPATDLPCGNIHPTVGITGTPVIDPAIGTGGEVFVVADELTGSAGASHHLIGIDLASGAIELDQVVDPPGTFPLYQLQRPGLALDDGQVVMAFGGNGGDCETPATPYHGWVAAVPEGGGTETTFEVANQPGDSQGAIWMGGAAPEVDASGNIWVTTGNSAYASASDPYDDSDGVLVLAPPPSLALEQYFAPSTWYSDNAADYDLSSMAPAQLSDGLIFQSGKSRTGYVLSQSDLGSVGGQLAEQSPYCGTTVDGGSAVVGDVVFVPCESGVIAEQISSSPPGMTQLWKTPLAGGPPIVAGGLVWTINRANAWLYGINPATGADVVSFNLGTESNDFPTASVADGLLLAPSSDQVHAFATGYATNPPGILRLSRATALYGGYTDRIVGLHWNNNSDGSVSFYQCATSAYAAASCTSALATATVAPATGTFPLTSVQVAVGVIDGNGDTCGLATSPQCYMVGVGSNGDQTSIAVHFAYPSAGLRRYTGLLGNYLDALTASRFFPVGDTVIAEQCDAAVTSANLATDCDTATEVTGSVNGIGNVVWSAPLRITVGDDYQEAGSGTCNPASTCAVVVTDQTNPDIFKVLTITTAQPTVFATPLSVPNAAGYQIGVVAKNFPIGETVDVTECDTSFTVGATAHCDSDTQIQGTANGLGEVAGLAWAPTAKMPAYTTTTPTVYSDTAGGSCAPGDLIGSGDPCFISTADATNPALAVATAFSITR